MSISAPSSFLRCMYLEQPGFSERLGMDFRRIVVDYKAAKKLPDEITVEITYHRNISLYQSAEPWIAVGAEMVEINIDHDTNQSQSNSRGIQRAKFFIEAYADAVKIAEMAHEMAKAGKDFDEVNAAVIAHLGPDAS